MRPYARTNIQLFNQLRGEGYSNEDIGYVQNAYELAMQLFTCIYRPSGCTFISHLVGTASILATLHVPIKLIVTGLLHAAYEHGDFGIIGIGTIPNAKRKYVKHAVGDEVEEYVARYTNLEWNSQTIPVIWNSLDALDHKDREVLLIRLANELEDNLNLGALYCHNAERRKRYIERWGPNMVEMAYKLEFPALAAELEHVFEETVSGTIPPELCSRNGRDRAYLIPPKSYQKGLTGVIYHLSFVASRRLRKLLYKKK